jgi:glycosyltransferase involved in cell wall biosynthesis
MKISVVIPAYNASGTIEATIESVLRQTLPPDEILVLDDGSTDETASIVRSYEPRITLFHQPNGGVASALNWLCQHAQGDVVAILGADDIWHPRYLEVQWRLYGEYPAAAAIFTGHIDFCGSDKYEWDFDPLDTQAEIELIPPLKFLRRYNAAPGAFANMSHCCIRKRVFEALGKQVFQLRMAEDLYFFNRLILTVPGPVVYDHTRLTAYRIREGSLSSNRLVLNEAEVRAFELLETEFRESPDIRLVRVFREGFATKRRQFAKVLLGVGRIDDARRQLWSSCDGVRDPKSLTKSLGLIFLSFLPKALQPTWPPAFRDLEAQNAGQTKGSIQGNS